jgi:site-specific DNA-methyltransferase (adenine-specific)
MADKQKLRYCNVKLNHIYHGDCLDVMKGIPDGSVDMILCDLPYGTTKCKWDTIIPFEPLWEQYERVIKENGAIVLTARQPFTSLLILSNLKIFRQTWVWDKVISTNFMNARKMHTQGFEDIVVFYKKLPTYNPQMEEGRPYKDERNIPYRTKTEALGSRAPYLPQNNKGERYPRGIIRISARNNSPLHPTQKPVQLFEYLIKTYTNEGEIVLDNCIGSGTTAIACINTGRNFIGIEKEQKYVELARRRVEEVSEESET